MQDNLEREKRISTCQGIQLLYRARKAALEEHEREIERLLSEYRNELSPQKRQALKEQNTSEIARITGLMTENRKLLQIHRGGLANKEQQLNDLENDYQFNQCSVFIGSIN